MLQSKLQPNARRARRRARQRPGPCQGAGTPAIDPIWLMISSRGDDRLGSRRKCAAHPVPWALVMLKARGGPAPASSQPQAPAQHPQLQQIATMSEKAAVGGCDAPPGAPRPGPCSAAAASPCNALSVVAGGWGAPCSAADPCSPAAGCQADAVPGPDDPRAGCSSGGWLLLAPPNTAAPPPAAARQRCLRPALTAPVSCVCCSSRRAARRAWTFRCG